MKKLIGPFKQILTMNHLAPTGHLKDEDLQPIHEAGVLINEGKILSLGSFHEMQKEGHSILEIDSDAVLIPGLIDAHTHLCFAGSRCEDYAKRLQGMTYQQVAEQGGGILHTMNQTRAASHETLIRLTLERTARLLSLGITTAEVKSGYGLNVTDEIKILRIINEVSQLQPVTLIPTCFGAHAKPPEFDSPIEYLDYLARDLLSLVRSLNLASRVDICIDNFAFTPEQARPFLKSAKELGFSICMHTDQFTRGGGLLAAEINALSADHLEKSEPQDFRALKKSGVIPIVLPGSSLGLGQPFAPAKAILDHDLPLVIASDWNPGSAPMGNLLTQAALLGAAEKLTHAETLAACTVRAARALQLRDRGILAPGMRADMVAFPCADYREILYQQGSLLPSYVFIEGK